jgi:hypothetical protein
MTVGHRVRSRAATVAKASLFVAGSTLFLGSFRANVFRHRSQAKEQQRGADSERRE